MAYWWNGKSLNRQRSLECLGVLASLRVTSSPQSLVYILHKYPESCLVTLSSGTYFSQSSLSLASLKFPWLQEVHSEDCIIKSPLQSLSVEFIVGWKVTTILDHNLPSASEAIYLLLLGDTGSVGKHTVCHNKCLMSLVVEKCRHVWLTLFESRSLRFFRLFEMNYFLSMIASIHKTKFTTSFTCN